VYHEKQKVGYSHSVLKPSDDGFQFVEDSMMRMRLLDAPQLVRVKASGHADRSLALRDIDFELHSGSNDLTVAARVVDKSLHLDIKTGASSSQQVIPLEQPIYLTSLTRASLRNEKIAVGYRKDVQVFDPMTLRNQPASLIVEAWEPVPDQPALSAWRVREESHGLKTTAWLAADDGSVLREEGPMGFTTVRETQDIALHSGWPASSDGIDIARQVAVPVNRDISDPRASRFLQLRVGGIPPERVPSDAEQRRTDSVVTIVRSPDGVVSFALPYRDPRLDLSEFLRATALMQVTDPRIQKASTEALQGETDAARGARRLMDWVYERLRKVPTVSLPNAVEILAQGEGDCNEHATLFTAMARAAGLPARIVAGVVYLNRAFLYHAWAEVWLGRWVSVDPTFDQMPVDATHLKLVEGDVDAQMSLMDVIGRLQIEVLADHEAS
ncbi:MAG TPA: transglutaminase domain-containing protein, partial [Candidatus Acidoferrales bacterium]|nr:transglutaminase domain-containing protein [Candidatus Acidoferrales bacterium]